MIDVHCHLNFPEFKDTRNEIIKKSKENFKCLIDSGASYKSNEESLNLNENNKKFIKSTLGYHPLSYMVDNKKIINKTLNQIENNIDNMVAIGEFGLDFSEEPSITEIKKQYNIFEKILNMATEYDMPIVLHVRDAEKQALNIVKKYTEIPNIIFHCFSGDKETVLEAVDYGYYISFATNAIRSKKHKTNMKKVPLSNMLTETDSPYLSPNKDTNNEPYNIKQTIERISRAKNIDFYEVEEATEKNAKTIFNI